MTLLLGYAGWASHFHNLTSVRKGCGLLCVYITPVLVLVLVLICQLLLAVQVRLCPSNGA